MTSQSHRLDSGGRIDRARTLTFSFNGRRHTGHPGDTLASALLANGVMLVGRGFKYHRPRGIFSAGAEEPGALVQLEAGARTEPNMKATQVELYDGLSATSVNCWPGVGFDLGAVNDRFSKLMPAGFYYKTFMWPRSLWMTYERVIRQAAGIGRAPRLPDPDIYDKMHAHSDVLVAGGGPAGLAAALAAGRTGARVILADEQAEFGGTLLGAAAEIDGVPALDWVEATLAALSAMPEVHLLPRTTVAAYYDHNYLALAERRSDHLGPGAAPEGQSRQRLWKVRAARVVLATGAIERPLVFADNDRPGIMLAAAARTYVKRYAVTPGRRAVVFTNNDSAYAAALDLHAAGVAVAAVVDVRPEPHGALPARARAAGIEVIANHAIVATEGRTRLRAVEVMALDTAGETVTGAARRIDCDLACVSGGWNPAVHLFSQSQGKLVYDDALATFRPGAAAQAQASVGAANGAFELADCLAEGFAAGAAAARAAGFTKRGRAPAAPSAPPAPEQGLRALWLVPARKPVGHGREKHFVDIQNDVTAADIALAAREGYRSVEHAKRYTTLGMGPDQGKTGNIAGLALLARALGKDIPDVGTTTFRPPYTPVAYGLLAGRDVDGFADATRRTPLHDWHLSAGAVFDDVGQWIRPRYYPREGEDMGAAVGRECRAVRQAVGILDAATLGKIDIRGPDAVKLLDWAYTNAWGRLEVGRVRYGLMLGEDGMVIDDGVCCRLGEHHYQMFASTGGAAGVMAWLDEWLQCEWTDFRVYLTSVSEQWAAVTLAGPKARELLAELASDIDLAPAAFPHMSFRDGSVAGIEARVFRVSFTGETSFEVNVAASYAMALWNACVTAGAKYGITPVGGEAIHVLRAEKGYIAVGHDTDGTQTPIDLGLGWAVSRKKKDFLGKRSLARAEMGSDDRKQLVGLLTTDPKEVLPEGAQIVAELRPKPPMDMIGHVTSSYYSTTLDRSIALALVKGGRARIGQTVHLPLYDRPVTAEITSPVFYDQEGSRLDG